MNFARLNHILVPATKDERDRFRRSPLARLVFGPLLRTWLSLTDEGRGLLGLSMVASLVGLDVVHGQNHLLWALCFALLAASVVVRPLLRLPGVRIEVEGPPRTFVGAETRFRVRLANEGEEPRTGLRLRLPFLPWDGTWLGAERAVALLAPGSRVTLEATARFVERGRHHIDAFGVGALVPLGLATGPAIESRGTRFVVVPRIAPIARLDWPERPRHQKGGVALASHTGESPELAGLRAWRDGDRIRDLHAPSWARLGEPVVREYQQEYFSRVAVMLDEDAMGIEEDRFEAAVSLAAGVVEHLMRSEALIDLVTTDARVGPRTLGRSLGGLDQALDRLAEVRPGAALDAGAAFASLRDRLDRLSALVFVTTRWDAPQRRLVERVAGAGAGVRTILVAPDGGAGSPAHPGLRVLRTTEIATARSPGRELWL